MSNLTNLHILNMCCMYNNYTSNKAVGFFKGMKREIKLSSRRQYGDVTWKNVNVVIEAKIKVSSALPLTSHESLHKLVIKLEYQFYPVVEIKQYKITYIIYNIYYIKI